MQLHPPALGKRGRGVEGGGGEGAPAPGSAIFGCLVEQKRLCGYWCESSFIIRGRSPYFGTLQACPSASVILPHCFMDLFPLPDCERLEGRGYVIKNDGGNNCEDDNYR